MGPTQETWLIVGLGNPGREYEKSRHNCGFRAMDLLADKLGCKVDRLKFQGLYGQCTYGEKKLILLKPQTFMNLSGDSVLQASAFFKIPPERIVVMFDDISLSPGRLRVRGDGSAGGHNGIKSIIARLGSQSAGIRSGRMGPGQLLGPGRKAAGRLFEMGRRSSSVRVRPRRQ